MPVTADVAAAAKGKPVRDIYLRCRRAEWVAKRGLTAVRSREAGGARSELSARRVGHSQGFVQKVSDLVDITFA